MVNVIVLAKNANATISHEFLVKTTLKNIIMTTFILKENGYHFFFFFKFLIICFLFFNDFGILLCFNL